MARIESLEILLDPSGRAFLAELYGKVIENVQKQTISAGMKNLDLSGDPTTGTVEANRYQNSVSKAYKTARTGGTGDKIVAKPVTIAVNNDKEIVEELENKDVKLYGVDGVLDRRAMNHIMSMVRELEEAFFLEAALNADNLFVEAGGGATLAVEIEKLITSLEKTRNNYVNGVDRQMMDIVLDVDTYSSFRVYLDEVPQAPNVNTAVDQFGVYHGVRIYSSVYLPLGVKALIMAKGAVAQPVMSNPYGAERIPLSNAFAVELFYSYGTKVVTPDLIWVWKRQLAKPAPTLAAAILTIPAVDDAVQFKIFDGATLKATINAVEGGNTTYDLALTVSGSGTHPITVIAVNNQEAFKESVASDVDNYVIA
jgi:hypothetical protein